MAINLRTRRSLGNPLVRRVQRHADLATLFRSPQQPFPGFTQSTAGVVTGEGVNPVVPGITSPIQAADSAPRRVPLVRASLIPTSSLPAAVEPAVTESPVPEVPQPAEGRARERGPEEAAQHPTVRPPQAGIPDEGRTAAVQPALPVQRAVEPSSASAPVERPQTGALTPAREEPAPAEPEDRIWSRLQNIFRRHQERQAQETSGEATSEPEAGSTQAEPEPGSPLAEPGQLPAEVQASREPQRPSPAADQEIESGREEAPQPELPELPEQLEQLELPEQLEQLDQPLPPDQADAQEQRLPGPAPEPTQPEPPQAIQAAGETRVQAAAERPKPAPPSLDEVAASDQPVADAAQEPPESPRQAPPGQPPDSSEPPQLQADQPGGSMDETLISPPPVVQPRAEPGETPAPDKPALTEPAAKPPQAAAPGPTPPTLTGETSSAMQPPEPQAAKLPIHPPASERASYPADVFAPPEADEPAEQQAFQPFPLQEAWPVQRMADQPGQAAEPQRPAPSSELANSPEARRVSSLLQDVTPGQPTGSHVEVVTPRRPRPLVTSTRSREQEPDILVQEKPEDEQAPPTPSQDSLRMPESQGEVASTQKAIHPTQTPEAPALVPTEIGALPADLWRLIGQEPPKTAPAGRASAAPVQRQAAATHLSETPPADHAAGTEEQFLPYQAPTLIQRVEAAETSEAGAGDEAGGEETNLDELSRKVYQEVKRRLATEWERMRRRI